MRFILLLLGLYLGIQLPFFHELGRFITDSGKEVMAPQRLLDGGVLYRDVFWLYGPWAPYFNSLMYALFGVHTDVLIWVAKLLGAGVVVGVYRCLRTLVPPSAAFIGALGVLAFSTTSGYFAWPYSFSNLWATCMALYAINALAQWQSTRSVRQLVLSISCTVIVVSCKFIIALPVLAAVWGIVLLEGRYSIVHKSSWRVAAMAYSLVVVLFFAGVTWYFSRFTSPESYLLQAGAGFHARHLLAAGIYERFFETIFLQNGTSPENISAALGILLCPASVLFGWLTWIYFWRNAPDQRPLLLKHVPFCLFAAGNLLQMNSSVHSAYVFPASAILLFSSLELWRNRPGPFWIRRTALWLTAGVMGFCLILGLGRLWKLGSGSYPLTSAHFSFQWPNANGRILQNLASDIREQTRPEDKIIIFTTFDYLYLLCDRKPALGYFYTWYEPFHDPVAAGKVEDALRSANVTVCVTHLTEPFSLAFAPEYRSHPIYQTLEQYFEPEINRPRWGEFVVWKKKPSSPALPADVKAP